MRKISLAMMAMLATLLMVLPVFAVYAGDGDLREIKLGVGATKYQMATPFPAAGVKCLRYMDGADGSVIGRTVGCFRMGPQFVIDSNGYLTVPTTTGSTGPAGADGAQGPIGLTGATGPAGAAAVVPTRTQASVTRTLGAIFQPNATRDVLGMYTVQMTTSASIASGQNGEVILEVASNATFTANVQTVGIAGNSQTYTLAVALLGVQIVSGQVSGMIPAGYYARLRTVAVTGTPTFTYRTGQEITL
jgi:hypothetical protein